MGETQWRIVMFPKQRLLSQKRITLVQQLQKDALSLPRSMSGAILVQLKPCTLRFVSEISHSMKHSEQWMPC